MKQAAPIAPRTVTMTPASGYVEWGCRLVGAVLAAALSFVLLTFGAAIGSFGHFSLAKRWHVGESHCHLGGVLGFGATKSAL